MIKARGNNPKKKNTKPDVIILYVNPLKILSNMCPDKMFAASLRPKDTLRARYEIVSIITSKGNRPKGQPAGTKREKNSNPCLLNPNIVAPSTIVKLNEKVKIK